MIKPCFTNNLLKNKDSMKRTITVLLFIITTASLPINAQISKGQVLMVNVTTQPDGITLNWPAATFTGNYLVFRRTTLNTRTWGTAIANLPSSASSYKDVAVIPGKSYEYWVVQTNGTNALAYGFTYAGNLIREVPYKGGIVLLIDSNYLAPLANEINQLTNDLSAEGWSVSKLYAGRKQTPAAVRSKLQQHVTARKHAVSTLMIIGHVPVPYSGGFTGDQSNWPPPDGHVEGSGNHTGAWPADGYYGDLDGVWGDNAIYLTTGNQSRHHNIIGDGKFDPTKFPSSIELEVGRIDLFDMPAFGVSDTVLMKRYFQRNHAWRTGQSKSIERALIDDNFGGLNLASTGFHNFSAFFHRDSIFENRDYMTTLKSNPYLWSYGCGAGSYNSCNGVGVTSDFAADSMQHIFTSIAGSFFGDWDISNSFLKAPLGRSALASFWGGIPKWYVHTMALGKHIGFGARATMNNHHTPYPNGSTVNMYFDGAFNYSDSSVHIALMGDPTLCNRHLPPVKGLTASSANKLVQLKWNKSPGVFDGYAVYRLDTNTNIYTKASYRYLVTDTTFTDSFNFYTGKYRYVVRTIKQETTASGSYYNLGGGSFADVSHTNAISKVDKPELHIYPNPCRDLLYFNDAGLHNFEIYDVMGRRMDIELNASGGHINLSVLPAGSYILRCLDAQNLELSIPVIKLNN
jgi:hypothetical protein